MPCSNAPRMGEIHSLSRVPPHLHPPMAQVRIATGDTLRAVPGISVSCMLMSIVSAWGAMMCSFMDRGGQGVFIGKGDRQVSCGLVHGVAAGGACRGAERVLR